MKNHETNFQKKFPFEKGAYHQCIPNPIKENEFITVQIVNRTLETMQKKEGGIIYFREQIKNKSLKYIEYEMVDPKYMQDDEDKGEG